MYHQTKRLIKSVIRLGNNEVLKTLTKTFLDADADANAADNAYANAEVSTIALRERCSDELKMAKSTKGHNSWNSFQNLLKH